MFKNTTKIKKVKFAVLAVFIVFWLFFIIEGVFFWSCGKSVGFNYDGERVVYRTVLGANNRCWMDRNLGAENVASSHSDSSAQGDLFRISHNGEINDPCPDGWRLPTTGEWDTEILSWRLRNITGAFASPLRITTTSFKEPSSYDSMINAFMNGAVASYWTVGLNEEEEETPLLIFMSYDSITLTENREETRPDGSSVRCIME